ncbi:unnamed protein product [Triticum turgidum subsp. durum]|uniref:SIAH-type domain-containing protein n=1 Tax=Triticum turgidum subsp. durum TaxID=4567 RepID=A0A9R1RWH3_TRITD|nr:unnamed protein product [Triticum turgidum subsp. durum]
MEEEKESGDGGRVREGEPRRLQKTNTSAASNGSIELDLLDCTICMDPLRPPVRSSSLPNKDSCHMCTATGGYSRCIALDKILESFCVPCSSAVYGCTVKTLYYKAEDHHNSCPQVPCFCPGHACSFAGTTVNLLAHLTGDHKWKSKEVKYDAKFTLPVKEGTWVLHARDQAPLFLVKFTPAAFGQCCLRPVRSTNLSDGLLFTENDGSSLFASSTRSITVSIMKIVRDKRKRGKAMRQSMLPFVAAS